MLSLVLAAALTLAPTSEPPQVVGIHDDMPGRTVATCDLITAINALHGRQTECAQLPPLGRSKVDVVLYDAHPSQAVADLTAALADLHIYDAWITGDYVGNAPGQRWGANAGTTFQPYDDTAN